MGERHALIIGAGIIGVTAGLALRHAGWAVTLVDPAGPGAETSAGNAGILSRGSVVPINPPGLWASLPRILAGRYAGARVHWAYALAAPRFMAGLLANATPARCRRTEAALNVLLDGAPDRHARLMAEAGIARRLRRTGWLKLYRSEAAFAAARVELAALTRFAIAHEVWPAEVLREREPALAPVFARGLWISASASVDDPRAVVEAYARLLVARGGRLVVDRVRAIAVDRTAVVLEGTGALAADRIVVAAGPWSADLLRPLGYHPPLGSERGTSRHYRVRGDAVLGRPIFDAAGGYVLTPMEGGVRLTTGADLSDRDRPQRFRQLAQAEAAARAIFPLDDPADAPWAGSRPALPDGRPAIGRVPGRGDLWCSFGHGHVGFTSGPASADLLAALMDDRPPPFDSDAFDPARFGR